MKDEAPSTDEQDVANLYHTAYDLVEEERFADARPVLEECLRYNPGPKYGVPARQELARVLLELGDREGALRLRLEVKRLVPDRHANLWKLAQLFAELGHYEEALQEATQAVRLQPTNSGYRELVTQLSQITKSSGSSGGLEIHGNKAYSPEHGCSLELPPGWKVRDVFGVVDPSTIMNLAPAGANWPNIEVTLTGNVGNPSVQVTQQFTHFFLRQNGWPMLGERMLTVAGRPAYEVSYEHKFPFWKFWYWPAQGKRFCKVSVIRDHTEYLVQLAAEDWEKDKPIFDACVESLQFDS